MGLNTRLLSSLKNTNTKTGKIIKLIRPKSLHVFAPGGVLTGLTGMVYSQAFSLTAIWLFFLITRLISKATKLQGSRDAAPSSKGLVRPHGSARDTTSPFTMHQKEIFSNIGQTIQAQNAS
jgi:hypothetical protein